MVPKTPPCDPRLLKDALITLTEEFDLQDEQIEALPALSQMSLIEQNDSHRISTEEGCRDAHAFKLCVGNMKWEIDGEKRRDPAFVYLFKSAFGRKNALFKTEICNGDIKEGHWPPFTTMYFGRVSDLAFPFNGEVNSERRSVVAKFYFKLGFEAGLYSEDPGFQVTETWKKHLRAACDDLLDAKKQAKAVKALRKQKHVRFATVSPPIAKNDGSQPLIRRTHNPFADQEKEIMTGNVGKARRTVRKSRDHLDPLQDSRDTQIRYDTTSDDRRPSPPPTSFSGGPQTTRRSAFPGFGQAFSTGYGAAPFSASQPPQLGHYPPVTIILYTQNSEANIYP